jgi:DNA-binding transcriptional LysR family regulator
MQRDLPHRHIDLAIGALPDEASMEPEIASAVLFNDSYLVMAAARSKWTRRRKIMLSDLIDEPWVLPPPDSTMGMHIARAFRSEGLEPPRTQVASFSIPLCHHLLASGRFLTVHPLMMIKLGKHLNLQVVRVPLPMAPRPIGILTLRNRTVSPLVRAFVDHAREMATELVGASGADRQ